MELRTRHDDCRESEHFFFFHGRCELSLRYEYFLTKSFETLLLSKFESNSYYYFFSDKKTQSRPHKASDESVHGLESNAASYHL